MSNSLLVKQTGCCLDRAFYCSEGITRNKGARIALVILAVSVIMALVLVLITVCTPNLSVNLQIGLLGSAGFTAILGVGALIKVLLYAQCCKKSTKKVTERVLLPPPSIKRSIHVDPVKKESLSKESSDSESDSESDTKTISGGPAGQIPVTSKSRKVVSSKPLKPTKRKEKRKGKKKPLSLPTNVPTHVFSFVPDISWFTWKGTGLFVFSGSKTPLKTTAPAPAIITEPSSPSEDKE